VEEKRELNEIKLKQRERMKIKKKYLSQHELK